MTMKELQRKLARVTRDLDALAQEFFKRGLGEDWNRLELASTEVGVVCVAFLEDREFDRLPSIEDCFRPEYIMQAPVLDSAPAEGTYVLARQAPHHAGSR